MFDSSFPQVQVFELDQAGDQAVALDIIDVEVSAGPGTYMGDYPAVGKVFIDANEYRKNPYLSQHTPATLRIVTVVGDSMEPTLQSRQQCVVALSNVFVKPDIYVFTYQNVIFIKQLQVIDGRLIAISHNPKYKPFEIVDTSQFIVHGRVLTGVNRH